MSKLGVWFFKLGSVSWIFLLRICCSNMIIKMIKYIYHLFCYLSFFFTYKTLHVSYSFTSHTYPTVPNSLHVELRKKWNIFYLQINSYSGFYNNSSNATNKAFIRWLFWDQAWFQGWNITNLYYSSCNSWFHQILLIFVTVWEYQTHTHAGSSTWLNKSQA